MVLFGYQGVALSGHEVRCSVRECGGRFFSKLGKITGARIYEVLTNVKDLPLDVNLVFIFAPLN